MNTLDTACGVLNRIPLSSAYPAFMNCGVGSPFYRYAPISAYTVQSDKMFETLVI